MWTKHIHPISLCCVRYHRFCVGHTQPQDIHPQASLVRDRISLDRFRYRGFIAILSRSTLIGPLPVSGVLWKSLSFIYPPILLATMACSSGEVGVAGATNGRMPGTPVGQLFKSMHTPPQQADEEERKKMRMVEPEGYSAPSRLVFEEPPQQEPSTPQMAGVTPTPSGSINVGLDQLAALLDQKLDPMQKSMAGLERQMGELSISVDERLKKMESRMDLEGLRIDKLESIVGSISKTGVNSSSFDVEAEVRKQLQAIQQTQYGKKPYNVHELDKRERTAVIGGVRGFQSVDDATNWLNDKLYTLWAPLPKHNGIYMKGDTDDMLFAEFASTEDRDSAVEILKRSCQRDATDGSGIWANADRPPATRAGNGFLFKLKKFLRDQMKMPYIIWVDEDASTLKVGGELAVTARIDNDNNVVNFEWSGAWANWDELHNNPEVKELLKKSDELLQRTTKGKKGAYKGTSKGK